MLGTSRTSLAVVRQAVNDAFAEPSLGQAGSDLLQVTDLLGRERLLRGALGDRGRPGEKRKEILGGLLQGKVDPLALALAETVVGQRWSSDSDMVDAMEIAGLLALFGEAEKKGTLDRTEEELFRFNRIAMADGELQLTISDPAITAKSKDAIIRDLLTDKATATTVQVAAFVVTHLRGRRMEDALSAVSQLAAERRGRLNAVVTTAVHMTDEQQARLETVLQRIYHQPVELNTIVDPTVVGGASVQIGDEVIDGTISSRLDQARRRLAGN